MKPSMVDRRTFLRVGGAAALAAAWQSAVACAPGGAGSSDSADAMPDGAGTFPLASVGVQLYTVRTLMQEDVDRALQQVAAAGYRHVETAGLAGGTAAELRALLDRHGLDSPAGHWQLEELEADPDGSVANARTLGQRYVVVPWIAEKARGSLDDWRALADRFNRLGERLRTAGLQFGYHNHEFEFETFGGQTPAYDVLVRETDPQLVTFEADLYWMYKAGHDPVTYFERYPGRFALSHVKDGTPAPEKNMVDVGKGAIDWPRIFAAAGQAGLNYAFVEHDEPADPIQSIRTSHAYLQTVLRRS